jgi:hypothetical protein
MITLNVMQMQRWGWSQIIITMTFLVLCAVPLTLLAGVLSVLPPAVRGIVLTAFLVVLGILCAFSLWMYLFFEVCWRLTSRKFSQRQSAAAMRLVSLAQQFERDSATPSHPASRAHPVVMRAGVSPELWPADECVYHVCGGETTRDFESDPIMFWGTIWDPYYKQGATECTLY